MKKSKLNNDNLFILINKKSVLHQESDDYKDNCINDDELRSSPMIINNHKSGASINIHVNEDKQRPNKDKDDWTQYYVQNDNVDLTIEEIIENHTIDERKFNVTIKMHEEYNNNNDDDVSHQQQVNNHQKDKTKIDGKLCQANKLSEQNCTNKEKFNKYEKCPHNKIFHSEDRDYHLSNSVLNVTSSTCSMDSSSLFGNNEAKHKQNPNANKQSNLQECYMSLPTLNSNTIIANRKHCDHSSISSSTDPTNDKHLAKRPLSILKSPKLFSDGHRRSCPKGLHELSRCNNSNIDTIVNDHHHIDVLKSTQNSNGRKLPSLIDLTKKKDKKKNIAIMATTNNYQECICHQNPSSNVTKSVQILTPTKSEQILFDPKLSAANSFFLPKHVDENKTNHSMKSNVVVDVDLNNVSDQNESVSYFNDNKSHNDMIESTNIEDKHYIKQYCNCSVEQIKPITYQICLNCHKPVNKKDCLALNLIQQQQPLCDNNDLETINNCSSAPLIDSSSYHYTYPNGLNSNFMIEQNGVYTPLTINRYDEESEELDSYFMEDRPRFCRKCNIWFGSLDPSYPSSCNCATTKLNTINTNDSGSIYSVHMQKDFRYYFQHPYSRLFVAYFVIFCNFLIFAEDPLSHSLMECSITVLGNVISLLFTKYPPQYEWQYIKGIMSFSAIIVGSFVGKYFFHHIVLRKIFRLKMFRDESGTWMIMLISTFLFCYLASQMYNTLLLMFHPNPQPFIITSKMGMTYASFMKVAACGTWCGDFFTAWMITDMMLQDNLYPNWAKGLRAFWHQHANIRILVFWSGSLVIAASVITIILMDVICWDCIIQGMFSTTEFSRAFLASSILVMDLLIVMQDWDFPHFVCDLNIKLPGLLQPSYTFNFFHKSVKFPEIELKITGKWFNYGIIVFVMMLDLNMWKNQVIYYPSDYGQYMDLTTNRVCSITDKKSIENDIKWTYDNRSQLINPFTNRTYIEDDLKIYSRYVGYVWVSKATSLIPILGGFAFFLTLVYFYGRFPPKTDASLGGRLPKRTYNCRSSWRRERRDDTHLGRISWPCVTIYNKFDDNQISFAHKDQLKNNIPIKNHSAATDNLFIPNDHQQHQKQQHRQHKKNQASSDKQQKSWHIMNILTPISSRLTPVPNFIYSLMPICNRNNNRDNLEPNECFQNDSTSSNEIITRDASVHFQSASTRLIPIQQSIIT